ncbi:MAG TPA: alpha/beta hydrolase, partial [Polyangiales bacterium]|nr:alpha/beta hydrolase [Polyangiales bacterium]
SGGFYDPGWFGRAFCRLKGHTAVTRHAEVAFARFHTKRRNAHTEAMFERIHAARSGEAYAASVAAIWREFATPAFDLRARGTLRCPTLLVWGARDPIVTLAQAGRSAERAIPGARLVALDTGHSPFVEAPDEFLAAVLPFLEQLRSGARAGTAA